jgi:peptidoglycan/xylan/chitin deacetylase (PgdA/CDA1 family)
MKSEGREVFNRVDLPAGSNQFHRLSQGTRKRYRRRKKPADRFEWQPLAYDSTKKYIYLSFDDGPQHGTVTCYDLCKKEAVKASFFMVGYIPCKKAMVNRSLP